MENEIEEDQAQGKEHDSWSVICTVATWKVVKRYKAQRVRSGSGSCFISLETKTRGDRPDGEGLQATAWIIIKQGISERICFCLISGTQVQPRDNPLDMLSFVMDPIVRKRFQMFKELSMLLNELNTCLKSTKISLTC